MANNTGKKFGGRVKGTPKKIITQVKNKLVELIVGTNEELSSTNLTVAK